MPAALARRKFTVNVAGLRTDVDEHVLPPNAGVLELENCVFDVSGAVSKRRGFSAMGNSIIPSGTTPNVWQLVSLGDSLVSLGKVGPNPLLAWSPTAGRWSPDSSALDRGPISVSMASISDGGSGATIPDAAVSGNYAALTYYAAGSAWDMIVDLVTGKTLQLVTPNPLVSNGFGPRVLSVNGYFVFMRSSSGGNINVSRWQISAIATTSAPATLSIATTSAALPKMDAIATAADVITIAYNHTDGTVHGVQYTVSTGAAGATFQFKDSAGANIAASQCLGWAVQVTATSPVLLIADSAGGVKGHIFGSGVTSNASVSTVIDGAATANVRNVTGWTTGATDYNVLYEVAGASPWLTVTKGATKVGGVVSTASSVPRLGLRSKPWQGPDGEIYAAFSYDSATQATNFMIRLPSDFVSNASANVTPVARVLTWTSNGKTESVSYLASMLSFDGGAIAPMIKRVRIESTGGVPVYFDTGLALVKFGFDKQSGRARAAADSLWVPGGGFLKGFDGFAYREATWHLYPEGLSVSYSAGAGALVAGSTYNWKAVYRYVDGQGRIRRSVPSDALQSTVTVGNNTAALTIPTARVSSARLQPGQSNVIELYRTTAVGTDYYRVATIFNDQTVDTRTVVDTVSDANLVSGELLYTTGGVLSSQPPPPLFAIEQFDQRLVGIDAEDRSLVRMTSQFVDGIAPAWNENLTIRLNTQWGDATGLVAMDDKLLIFFRNAIYYIAGVGPDASGNGAYNAPALIATGTGCAEAQCQSIIYTGTGVMYLADVGFQNIDRGLNVTDIGAPVERYTDAGVTVAAAIQVSAASQIRFFTAEGNTLVWDYLHQAWSVFTGQPSQTATMWGQTPVCALNGLVYAEDNTFMERGARYEQKVTFPWLSLAGLRGYKRLYKVQPIGLTSPNSGGNLIIFFEFAYNFDDSTSHDQSIQTSSGEIWEWEARPERQLEHAVRLGMFGAAIDDSDNGFTLVGVTLEYGVKPGLYPVDKLRRAV